MLKLAMKRDGYPTILLRFEYGGRKRNVPVHVLVAAAFIGPRPAEYHINHKDGVKTNNAVENLEYVTPRENARHAVSLGLYAKRKPRTYSKPHYNYWAAHPEAIRRGELATNVKVTTDQVREIRRLVASGVLHKHIAAQFNITRGHVGHIARRLAWKHVDPAALNGGAA